MTDTEHTTETTDVLIIGGGVAGLSAGIFTARAALDTLVVNHGESILRRNAHLENFPGFPAGISPRLFLDMLDEQARRAGCEISTGTVTDLRTTDGGFVAETADCTVRADRVVAASWADTDYLDDLGVELRDAGSKQFIQPDDAGRTTVDGLYAAGRLADQYHQAIVAAGHGSQVGISVVHDADPDFYHDWVVPEGYFTNRDRDVPKGCEEIDDAERQRRERESRALLSEFIDGERDDEPTPHPSSSNSA